MQLNMKSLIILLCLDVLLHSMNIDNFFTNDLKPLVILRSIATVFLIWIENIFECWKLTRYGIFNDNSYDEWLKKIKLENY